MKPLNYNYKITQYHPTGETISDNQDDKGEMVILKFPKIKPITKSRKNKRVEKKDNNRQLASTVLPITHNKETQ